MATPEPIDPKVYLRNNGQKEGWGVRLCASVDRQHYKLVHQQEQYIISTNPEMGTFEWDILNPDRIINLEIKNEWKTSNI